VNYDEMDGDRLRLLANRNCYRLSRVSWALLRLLVDIGVAVLNTSKNYGPFWAGLVVAQKYKVHQNAPF